MCIFLALAIEAREIQDFLEKLINKHITMNKSNGLAYTLLGGIASFSLISPFVLPSKEAKAQSTPPQSRVSANASVNLVDGPNLDEDRGLNPFASASASGGGGSASSTAGANLSLSASASSASAGLTRIASAGAGFGFTYQILGNPDQVSIPISFNFGFDGSVSAQSTDTPGSAANAIVSYSLIDGDQQLGGSSLLSSGFGQPTAAFTTGGFGEGTFGARLTPEITLEALNLKNEKLSEDEVERLELNLTVPIDSVVAEVPLLAGAIVNAIQTIGIPGLNIPAGRFGDADVNIGFDTEFFFDTQLSFSKTVESGGLILGTLGATASSSEIEASAEADFGSTLELESITVPQTFDLVDADGLQVLFESGFLMDVTREGGSLEPDPNPDPDPNPEPNPGLDPFPDPEPESIPEPSLLFGLAGVAYVGLSGRKRR